MSFHINDDGEPGDCDANKGKCPFGGPEQHFTSMEAAQKAFEESMGDLTFASFQPSHSEEIKKIHLIERQARIDAQKNNYDTFEKAREAWDELAAAKDKNFKRSFKNYEELSQKAQAIGLKSVNPSHAKATEELVSDYYSLGTAANGRRIFIKTRVQHFNDGKVNLFIDLAEKRKGERRLSIASADAIDSVFMKFPKAGITEEEQEALYVATKASTELSEEQALKRGALVLDVFQKLASSKNNVKKA